MNIQIYFGTCEENCEDSTSCSIIL